jgi:hypothetical protein
VSCTTGRWCKVVKMKSLSSRTLEYGGLNVWKTSYDQIFHVTTVSNYNVFGQPKEKLQLPMEHYSYSIVPPKVGSDVMLYNGISFHVGIKVYKPTNKILVDERRSTSKLGTNNGVLLHRKILANQQCHRLLSSRLLTKKMLRIL